MRDRILSSTWKFYTRFGVIIALLFGVQLQVSAQSSQTSARPDRGTASNGTYSMSDIERINVINGNLGLNISLASLPPLAGGKLNAAFTASYNSKTWDVKREEIETEAFPSQRYEKKIIQASGQSGWSINAGYTLVRMSPAVEDFGWLGPELNDPDYNLFQANPYTGWSKVFLITPDGSRHELRPMDDTSFQGATRDFLWSYYWQNPNRRQQANVLPNEMRYYSYDGSFIWARIYPDNSTNVKWEVYLPDGTQIVQKENFQRIWDTNLNRVKIRTEIDPNTGLPTVTHLEDERATGALREITYSRNFSTNVDQVRYRMFGDNWATIDIEWATTTVWRKTYIGKDHTFGTNNICDRETRFDASLRVIKKIILPSSDGLARREFSFGYNSDTLDTSTTVSHRPTCQSSLVPLDGHSSKGWGSISKMTLPTGAEIFYTYSNDNDHFLLEPDDAAREKLQTKEVKLDSVSIGVWSYGSSPATGSVVGPDGSRTDEFAYTTDPGYSAVYGGPNGLGGLTYKTIRYLNNVPNITVQRHYTRLKFDGGEDIQPGSFFSATFNAVVDTEYTTLHDSAGVAQKMSAKKFTYDYNGNVTEVKSYDWFSPGDVVPDPNNVGLPMGVPNTATLLRTETTSFYNQATPPSSSLVYAKQLIGTVNPTIFNAPQETIVGASKTRYSYDATGYPAAPNPNGNLRKLSVWDSHNSKWIDTLYEYDAWGNRKKVIAPSADASGTTTTLITFGDNTHANPTEVKIGPDGSTWQQVSSTVYDYYTGLVTSQTDINGQVTNIDYTNQLTNAYDVYGRPGFVLSPAVTSFYDGTTSTNQRRKVVTRYFDTARQVEAISDLKTQGDGLLKSRTSSDKLGRTTLSESSEDGTNYTISSQTIYVQMGRITKVSNPKRSAAATTDGWTRTTRDDLGRIVEMATFNGAAVPDNSNYTNSTGKVLTSYSVNQTTVTDQANKSRKTEADGLGRLVRVFEDPNGANLSTKYFYDVLGNLIEVEQSNNQHRFFTYDTMSRLRTAKNPEQVNGGTQMATTYNYDDAANLLSRTNPNSTTVSFTYDGLNRAKTKTLSTDSIIWNYNYDTVGVNNSKGKLTSAIKQGTNEGTYYDGFDEAGRIQAAHQTTKVGTQEFTYTTSYAYNLAGNLTKEVYPSGKEYRTSYDEAGRVAGVKNQTANIYYAGALWTDTANRLKYTAHGAVSTMKLGNGRWEHTNFNSRLQPIKIGLGSSASDASVLRLDYSYNTPGQTDNNGNLLSQSISVPKPDNVTAVMNQSYIYDPLNRLQKATETDTWTQTYDYDPYGNRAVRSGSSIPASNLTPVSTTGGDLSAAISPTTNRLLVSGYTYDISGNVTKDPSMTGADVIAYDSENRQTSYTRNGSMTKYSYDAGGRRVKKEEPGNLTTVFVYDGMGKMIAEYKNDPLPPAQAGGGTSYLTSDTLGSTRVVTGSGGEVKSRRDYLPFGEEINGSIPWGVRNSIAGYGASDGQRLLYTGKEKDAETGLDYFGQRYFSGAAGRFTSTDPNPVTKENFVNPQRFNLYVYVNNNPFSAIDPSGGDGEGKGGDKVISIFLQYAPADRNTVAGKLQSGVNWKQIQKEINSGNSGYKVNLYGNADVGGDTPATGDNFASAQQNSELVIYVGHSFLGQFGVVGGQPVGRVNEFVPGYVLVGETAYGNGGQGVPIPGGNEIGGYVVTGPKLTSSASAVCTFACNSYANPDYIDGPAGQRVVTVKGGKDGVTSVGALEKAAEAFAKAYVAKKGSVEDKVKAGVKAAQKAIDSEKDAEFKGQKINKGDKVASDKRQP
jgi:RHS repeat-associated protein